MIEAGRELDVLVATKIMGCTVIGTTTDDPCCGCKEFTEEEHNQMDRRQGNQPHNEQSTGCNCCDWASLKHYSTDMWAAWEVVDRLIVNRSITVSVTTGDGYSNAVVAIGDKKFSKASDAPHAICIAALRAVGVEVGE